MKQTEKPIEKLMQAVGEWISEKPWEYAKAKKSSTEMSKLDPKINFKAFFINLNEISDKNDIIIKLPVKKVPEAAKPVPKPKNTIALF